MLPASANAYAHSLSVNGSFPLCEIGIKFSLILLSGDSYVVEDVLEDKHIVLLEEKVVMLGARVAGRGINIVNALRARFRHISKDAQTVGAGMNLSVLVPHRQVEERLELPLAEFFRVRLGLQE